VPTQPLTLRGLGHALSVLSTRVACKAQTLGSWWLDLPILDALVFALLVASFLAFLGAVVVFEEQWKREKLTLVVAPSLVRRVHAAIR
jgi:hypothetical protein